jgi:hypothetical protein
MKRIVLIVISAVALLSLAGAAFPLETREVFPNISGHWAEDAFVMAFENGLIDGDVLRVIDPDADIPAACIFSILSRATGVREPVDVADPDAPMTRMDAYNYMAEAFGLVDAQADMSALERFHDYGEYTREELRGTLSLVSLGIVRGHDGWLFLDENVTWAGFLRAIERIAAIRVDVAPDP